MVVSSKEMKREQATMSVMELSKHVIDCCDAFTNQALNAKDVNLYAGCMKSCLELVNVANSLLYALSLTSENIKTLLKHVSAVVVSTERAVKTHKNDGYCKMSTKLCMDSLKEYKKALADLHKLI